MKLYLKVKPNNQGTTHLKIDVYYDKGGYQCFTGKTKARGYYVSASPVELGDRFESYKGFTGSYDLIAEAGRLSKSHLEKHGVEISRQIEARSGQAWTLAVAILAKNNLELGGTNDKL